MAKAYGEVVALAGVDLSVDAGEVLAIVGPNGAGKTTLLSAVAGLVSVDDGGIEVGGIDARATPPAARRLLGVAPQRLGLSPTLTVVQNLVFAGRLSGMAAGAARTAAAEVAADLGLEGLMGRPAGRLSGGEQRRVHVGWAVVHRPPLVLLDEPTSGVDPAAREVILDLVRRLAAEGSAVVFSTHLLDEVEELSASVAILHHGRVVARDSVAAVIERHGSAVVEVTRAGLGSAFRNLTGERYPGGD